MKRSITLTMTKSQKISLTTFLYTEKNTMRSEEEERIIFLLCHHYFLTISLIYNCFLAYFLANYTWNNEILYWMFSFLLIKLVFFFIGSIIICWLLTLGWKLIWRFSWSNNPFAPFYIVTVMYIFIWTQQIIQHNLQTFRISIRTFLVD